MLEFAQVVVMGGWEDGVECRGAWPGCGSPGMICVWWWWRDLALNAILWLEGAVVSLPRVPAMPLVVLRCFSILRTPLYRCDLQGLCAPGELAGILQHSNGNGRVSYSSTTPQVSPSILRFEDEDSSH